MKTALYELAGDRIPEALRGTEIKYRNAETLDEMAALVDDGKPENVLALAQAQRNIVIQRHFRNLAESEETAAILAGQIVGEGDNAVDWGQRSPETRKAYIVSQIEDIGATWLYGAKAPGTGTSAANRVNKEKASQFDEIKKRAAEDPELAAKLAALNISL